MDLITETVKTMKELNIPYFQGQRHHSTLALAGWLRKRGFLQEEVEEIVRRIATHFGDDEIVERIHNVQTTFSQDLENVAGWKMLVEILGEEVAKELDYKIPTIFLYTNEAGTPLFRVIRWDTPNGKTFHTQHFDGEKWQDGLGNVRKVLYRLPEVKKAIEKGDMLFIVEGEKCVHAMEKLGFVATTNAFGASAWLEEYSKQLIGANEVIILPDNDSAGKKHAEKVKRSLEKHGIPCKIVEIPNLGDGEDIADAIARKEIDREKLLKLIEKTDSKSPTVQVFEFSEFLKYTESLGQIEWLVQDIIPKNGLVLVSGRPKRGKSTLARQLLAGIALNNEKIALNKAVKEAPVVITALEDFPQAVAQQLLNLGALPNSPISVAMTFGKNWKEFLKPFEGRVVLLDPAALIIGIKDMNDYSEIYNKFGELREFAKNADLTLILVTHDKKPSKNELEALDNVLGSTAITGVVDVIGNLLKPTGGELTARELKLKSRLKGELSIDLKFSDGIYLPTSSTGISAFAFEILDFLTLYPGSTKNTLKEAFHRSGATINDVLEELRRNALVYYTLDRNRVCWYPTQGITMNYNIPRGESSVASPVLS
ncbi:AAA family ATPase [Thermoanaerobacter uzonensis]|uniref:AAA family ATPase n=1 Tax=Thermoanaerobacter uzonensis TaxID=447593 RepID=UPI003D7692A6